MKKEEMASYKTNEGGVFTAGHKFRIMSLYISNNYENLRRYGVLQPVATMKGGLVPFVYNMQDVDDEKIMAQCEEGDLKLVKKGDPTQVIARPVYTQIGKNKTTEHVKPRTDNPDLKLKKELESAKKEASAVAANAIRKEAVKTRAKAKTSKFSLNLRGKTKGK